MIKALEIYEEGMWALSRRIVIAMNKNHPSNPIFKHRDIQGKIWFKCAIFGAMYLGIIIDDVDQITWPTEDQTVEEERTEAHAGLYWEDMPWKENETSRFFLPNFFNTFQKLLMENRIYADLIGNRGTVLKLLGRHEEAHQHFEEASEFLPSQ